jgi:hypothetical protein
MDGRALLAETHLTVVSGEPDFDLQQIAQIIARSVTAAGWEELEELFGRLLAAAEHAAAITPKTLDLIGHTRSSASLLALGDWVIDVANPATTAFFRGLVDREVLPRLGVRALRLLGCNTAGTAQGCATITQLGDLLGLEVFGTNQLLTIGHYGAGGFCDCWSCLLVSASELRRGSAERGAALAGDPHPRILDLVALPAITLGEPVAGCPRRVATVEAARHVLQLVRRGEGAHLLGRSTVPMFELALPSDTPDAYHLAHVVLDGEFLQFYPDGMSAAGILFPVDDARALLRIVAALPSGPALNH